MGPPPSTRPFTGVCREQRALIAPGCRVSLIRGVLIDVSQDRRRIRLPPAWIGSALLPHGGYNGCGWKEGNLERSTIHLERTVRVLARPLVPVATIGASWRFLCVFTLMASPPCGRFVFPPKPSWSSYWAPKPQANLEKS